MKKWEFCLSHLHTMTNTKCLVSEMLVVALLWQSVIAQANYHNQPKILAKNGDLIVEAAEDRNIRLRLSRDSALMLDNVDIMERLRRHSTPPFPSLTFGEQVQNVDRDLKTAEEIQEEVHLLQEDTTRLSQRLSAIQTSTRHNSYLGTWRRNFEQMRRLSGRLKVLERKVNQDKCALAKEPCKNGATCYSLYEGFHCDCPDAWTGETCEEDVDECYLYAGTDLGCQNNAVCENTPGSYRCQCVKGFSGSQCRLLSSICHLEQSRELCGHGACVPANNQQGYTCICDQGWSKNTTASANTTESLVCQVDVNECEEHRNPCHSDCINLPGSFKCGPCPPGYTGNGVSCMDINECDINNGGCSSQSPKVRCINTEGSYRCGSCPVGWIGDGRSCDLAPTSSCNSKMICHPQAKCEYISNVPTCTCRHGMFGHGFGPDGCHTTPINDPCENHMCMNNGTCLSTGRGTSCLCPQGYSGGLCETADACHPNPCKNDAKCKALPYESYRCSCTRGLTGKHCEVLRRVCGSVETEPSGEVIYPSNGTAEYAFDEKCTWFIRTTPSDILNITFISFDVQNDTECNKDWLEVYDGYPLASQLIGRFCGKKLPQGGSILSSQHQMFFRSRFQSDNAINRPGYHLQWHSQPHICGETIQMGEGDDGVIRSPGYPGKTSVNRECQWSLIAPYGYRFVIRVYEVRMGIMPNCTGDSLKIYDADILLQELCQSSSPELFKSSSNELKIHLHTDSLDMDTSFQLHYEVTSSVPHCGGMFTEPSGIIVEPMVRGTCLYLIQQQQGTRIRFEFLTIYKDNMRKIEIFDGKSVEDPILTLMGFYKIPPTAMSTSNFMLVRFNSYTDEFDAIPHKFKYTRVCEFKFTGPNGGGFATLNYPKAYAENTTCTYQIIAPDGHIIYASILDFYVVQTGSTTELEENTRRLDSGTFVTNQDDESMTYVDIYLSSSNKQRYFSEPPATVISEQNNLTIVFHATTNQEKATGFRVDFTFEKLPSGGVYTKNEGYLSRTANGYGEYIIEAPQGMYIKLTADVKIFQVFQDLDMVLIYGNATEGRDYLLKNITNKEQVEEIFHFNIITILVFNYAYWTNAQYEFISSDHACGGNFSQTYGQITSPNWPGRYTPHAECVWTIFAPLGKQIELVVHNFTLYGDCGIFLEVRNGMSEDSPLIGRYCKDEIPSRIPSFANSLYLRFKVNYWRRGPGFLITWQQTKIGCGGKLTSYKGSIHSPLNPNAIMESDSLMTCGWQIHVVQGSSIAITISPSIAALEFCRSNTLKIFDDFSDAKSLLPFNCSQAEKDGLLKLLSTSNVVLVVFDSTQDINFVLDYETHCHMMLEHIHGVIESPTTSDEQNCKWDIRARGGNKVKLAFSHLSLETLHMVCPIDYVEVRDMMNEEVLQEYHLCREIPPPIVSIGNHLVVRFVSGLGKGENSFRAEYTQLGCGDVISNQMGNINSPKYPYSIDVDCEWYFKAPAGMQIILTIKELKIDVFNPDCLADALTVRESKNSSRFLLQECSSQQGALIVTSPFNQLYLHFRTGPTRIRKYFKASHKTEDAICGGVLKSKSGFIASPNYPLNSTQGTHCKWQIFMPHQLGMVIRFSDIQISQSHNCSESYLKISELKGSKEILLMKICSLNVAQTVIPNRSNVVIEYVISGSQGWGRFSMEFRKQCGGKISEKFGTLRSHAGENCVWWFEVPEGAVLRLNIINLECYCHRNDQGKKECSNGLGFKETPDIGPLANYSKFYCEEHQSRLTLEGPSVYIFANGIQFSAVYTTGGDLYTSLVDSARGTLEYSHIDGVYLPHKDLTWYMNAAPGNKIQLQIYELNIAKSEHCNEDFLEVSGLQTVLGVYCGNTPPDDDMLAGNFLTFRLHNSLVGSTTNSFKLNWSYAHLNEISNATDGIIQSPPIILVRSEDEPFGWRILVNRNNFITLHFEQYLEGLELFDGFDDTALPVTIHPSPWRFVSSSNVVYLQTINENLQHFLIQWNITNTKTFQNNTNISTCHSEFFVKSQQVIVVSSPGYPVGYEPNLQCDWILKPFEANEHVVCEIYDVMIERTDGCRADFLAISISSDLEQWHEIEKICNTSIKMSKPFKVFHGTPNIKVDFVSDYAINGTGFRAVIKTACGSNLTESVGVIEGDKLRSNETECMWRVSTKPTTRILLQLNFAPTNKSFQDDCQEYALIHDGVDEHAPLLPPGKICNSQNGSEILLNSTSNFLTIKYKLSPLMGLQTKSTWTLKYRAFSPCNADYRLIAAAPSVNVTSPNYPNVPHPHTECEWRIVAPVGDTIQVDFIDNFDMNLKNCENEFLELFDGSTPLSKTLGRFCHKPPMLKTTQRVLYMRYLTDANEPRSGFKARISLSKCGGSFSEMNGSLISPGYSQPGGYATATECDYAINLPAGATTQLVVQDINLPFDAIRPKSKDYMEVIPFAEEYGHEQEHVYIYGNTTKGKTYHFNANKVIVRFHTFFTNLEFRGFRIAYHGFEGHCKQITTSDSGYLTMGLVKTRKGEEEVVDANCEWKIVVPKGQRVRLEFLNLNDYRGQNLTESPRISVFSDPECACKILEFDINSYDRTNSTIQSSDNIMIVRMYMPHVKHRMQIIKAYYTSDEVSPCPANIDSDNALGAIDIIDTNSTFSRPYYCDIPITLSNRETLFFRIVSLQVDYDKLPENLIAAPLMFLDNGIITKYQQNQTNVVKFHNQGNGALRIVQTQTGHIRRLRMNYKRHKCGGYFKLVTWMVQLEQPVTYLNSGPLICAWTLVQDFSGSTVMFKKYELSANFSFTGSCEIEYITIGHSESPDSEASIKICQNNQEQFHSYVWQQQYTHVIYRSVKYQESKFSMIVKSSLACGSEVQVLQKKIFLDIYKTDYENNQECVWTFNTAPGFQMQFSFLRVAFIEESINCTKDYLEFQRYEESLWMPDVRFCGRVPIQTFNATSSRMRLLWRTNEAITADGFDLIISRRCSLALDVTSSVQRIESPAEGFDANSKLRCDYTFNTKGDPKKMVIVKTKFNGVCTEDSFYVTKLDAHGIESNEAHCESELEIKAFKSMRLEFNVYEAGYYTIEYVLDTCGGNITTSGSFIRPLRQDLRDLYANNMDCVWYVTAPADYSIAVRFKYFDTEEAQDYVSIYAGSKLEEAKLLKSLSGNLSHTPPVIMVDHNRAIINAVSNSFFAAKGFEAEIVFMHNCNERISLTDATAPITLARNFKLHEGEEYMCTYRITAPKDHRIGIEIKKLRINDAPCTVAQESCQNRCNAIEIFDSLATKQGTMGTFCTSSTASSFLMSSYEDTMLLFTAKQPGELKFEIGVTMEKSTCGQLKENKVNGSELFQFTFPPNGQQSSYSPNIHCTWRLPLHVWMEIDFDYIDLQNTSQITGKCLDYIEIKEAAISTKYCGHAINFTSNVLRTHRSNDYADITFHSDASVEGKGFKFVVHRAMTCNRTYHQASGVIDFATQEETVCSNTIVVPDRFSLIIYVTNMLYGRSACFQRQNKIIDKGTNQVLFDLCKMADVTKTKVFSTNSSVVRLDFMDYATVSYSATPRNVTPGCGGTWNSRRGIFASPSYENDRNFSECRWDIIVPAPNIIHLEFYDFDMGAMTNCPLDNVQVFDIYPDGSAILLRTLCGSEQPDEFKSTSNHVMVVSKKSPNFDGFGWSVTYVMMGIDRDKRN